MPPFDGDSQALLRRVTPMLDEVDLKNHEWLSFDMDDPLGLTRKYGSEKILKLSALCDLMKITPRECNHLVLLERQSEKSRFESIVLMLNGEKEFTPTSAVAQMSGTRLNDETQKLLVLLHQKKITRDEHRRWMNAWCWVNDYVDREWEKTAQ